MTPLDTDDQLTIEATYCGPPTSAHGGVAVGRFAETVESVHTEVRLLGPPPLELPLASRTDDDGTVWVSEPGGDLARVRAVADPPDIAPFSRVPEADVQAAARQYLDRVAEKGHAFPTCFACGPDRHDPDALRQFTGRASDGDAVARFHVDGEGPLPDWLTLAGLDCPSGHTIFTLAGERPDGEDIGAAVLGSMSCTLHGTGHAGVDYQVRGRIRSMEGRKLTSEVAMLAPDGTTVAEALAVWIAVDTSTFGAD